VAKAQFSELTLSPIPIIEQEQILTRGYRCMAGNHRGQDSLFTDLNLTLSEQEYFRIHLLPRTYSEVKTGLGQWLYNFHLPWGNGKRLVCTGTRTYWRIGQWRENIKDPGSFH
jgi:hypothetical protein